MSDQAKFSILKRKLDSIRKQKWLVILFWWIIISISQFSLKLERLDRTVSGLIVGAALTAVIWFYYTKKEKQILNQITQLKI